MSAHPSCKTHPEGSVHADTDMLVIICILPELVGGNGTLGWKLTALTSHAISARLI